MWERDPTARVMRSRVHAAIDARVPGGARVLDLGCGTGIDSEWLWRTGRDVVGLDASAEMVGLAKERVPGAHFEQSEITQVPQLCAPGSFDAVLLDFGVPNCVSPEILAAVLAHCLRPGGWAFVVWMPRVPALWLAAQLLRGRWGMARQRLAARADVPVGGGHVSTHYPRVRRLQRVLDPEFELVERQALGLVLPPPRSRRTGGWAPSLDGLDARLGRLPLLRDLGDHSLWTLQRRARPKSAPAWSGLDRMARKRALGQAARTGVPAQLRTLILELTHGCQSACAGCDHRGPAGGEALDLGRALELAAEAKEMGAIEVMLTGGEPLLRPDLVPLMAGLRGLGLAVYLLTNGLALARQATAVAQYASAVWVSIDAPDGPGYLRTRGVAGFGAVCQGIEALRAAAPQLPIVARVTVSALNDAQLCEIAEHVRRLGCDQVSFLAADIASSQSFGRSQASDLAPGRPAVLRAQIASLRQRFPRPFLADSDVALQRLWRKPAADLGQMPHRPPGCDAPFTSVVVGPQLRLRPCFFLPSHGSAQQGLRLGMAQGHATLATLDVARNPVCARCVCWRKEP